MAQNFPSWDWRERSFRSLTDKKAVIALSILSQVEGTAQRTEVKNQWLNPSDPSRWEANPLRRRAQHPSGMVTRPQPGREWLEKLALRGDDDTKDPNQHTYHHSDEKPRDHPPMPNGPFPEVADTKPIMTARIVPTNLSVSPTPTKAVPTR